MGRMHVKRMVFVKKKKISGILGTLLVLVIAGFQLFTQTGILIKVARLGQPNNHQSKSVAGNTTTEEILPLAELRRVGSKTGDRSRFEQSALAFEKIADKIRSVDAGDTFVFYAEKQRIPPPSVNGDTPESQKTCLQPYGQRSQQL